MTFTEVVSLYRFAFAGSTPKQDFRFTLGDLRHSYSNGQDCPLYQGLKRSGAPVAAVAGDFWVDKSGLIHWFDKEMQDASGKLLRSDTARWTRLFTLWGNRYSWTTKNGQRLTREEASVILRR